MNNKLPIEKLEILDIFLKENTKHFDSSHDWQHANKVYEHALAILDSMQIEYDIEIIAYAAKLHDVCDHKYPESIQKEALEFFIESQIGSQKTIQVLQIIDNISYSKEISGKRQQLNEPLHTYLTVISDADRLEAIGMQGIERCATYVQAKGGKIPEDVIQHCYDKLLKLYRDGYIKTPHARKIAAPLHQQIEDYVNTSVGSENSHHRTFKGIIHAKT